MRAIVRLAAKRLSLAQFGLALYGQISVTSAGRTVLESLRHHWCRASANCSASKSVAQLSPLSRVGCLDEICRAD
jgi:hypothetical protein